MNINLFLLHSRWAKSTLVLVPLFGAHYTLFLGLSYHTDNRVELVWLFCDQFFASFQVFHYLKRRKRNKTKIPKCVEDNYTDKMNHFSSSGFFRGSALLSAEPRS